MVPVLKPVLDVPTEPLHPSDPVPPLAVQLAASVDPQVSDAELPA
jgi:hypothetical protein